MNFSVVVSGGETSGASMPMVVAELLGKAEGKRRG